jgi:hypothetical protein
METTLLRDDVADFLRSLKGSFFTIEFIKRSTGENRVMTATTNYQTKLAGGEAAYDFTEKKLLPVWDLTNKGFRSIPTDAVLTIKAKGNTYTVTDKE